MSPLTKFPIWVRQGALIRALVAAAASWHLLLELAGCRYMLIRLSLGYKHMQQVLFESTRQPKGQLCAPSVSKCIRINGSAELSKGTEAFPEWYRWLPRGEGQANRLLLPLACVIMNITLKEILHSLSKVAVNSLDCDTVHIKEQVKEAALIRHVNNVLSFIATLASFCQHFPNPFFSVEVRIQAEL